MRELPVDWKEWERNRMEEKIVRKLRKLARRCAEANTWSDASHRKTVTEFHNVWIEAFQLIKLAGLMPEYEKRERQIKKARELISPAEKSTK